LGATAKVPTIGKPAIIVLANTLIHGFRRTVGSFRVDFQAPPRQRPLLSHSGNGPKATPGFRAPCNPTTSFAEVSRERLDYQCEATDPTAEIRGNPKKEFEPHRRRGAEKKKPEKKNPEKKIRRESFRRAAFPLCAPRLRGRSLARKLSITSSRELKTRTEREMTPFCPPFFRTLWNPRQLLHFGQKGK
jgi:hypothetical protein